MNSTVQQTSTTSTIQDIYITNYVITYDFFLATFSNGNLQINFSDMNFEILIDDNYVHVLYDGKYEFYKHAHVPSFVISQIENVMKLFRYQN